MLRRATALKRICDRQRVQNAILLLYCRTTPSETQNLPHLIDLLYLCHITYTTPYVRIYHHNLLL